VTTVVEVGDVVTVVVVSAGNVTDTAESGCVLTVRLVLPEQDLRPDVAFIFHEVAVFNNDVFVFPLAFSAELVKFLDCCV